ncbi:MAG: alpha/beta hydrolase family protein [Minisyncoccota bacterium]
MTFFAGKGYWVFMPRYQGTWESDGEFLKCSPHLDILSVMNGVSKGFVDAWSEKKIRIANPRFYLLGSSFGGPAVILASLDKRVVKAVAISPVIDWSKQEETKEPLDFLDRFVPLAFGNAYRGGHGVWKKLEKGKLYAPLSAINKIDGRKLMLIHAKDDDVVSFSPTREFAERANASFIGVRSGGHMGSGNLIRAQFWKKIEPFLKA